MVSFCGVAWLIRSQALAVLPVLSSLKALRQLAKASHAAPRENLQWLEERQRTNVPGHRENRSANLKIRWSFALAEAATPLVRFAHLYKSIFQRPRSSLSNAKVSSHCAGSS
jgi:hypothetical protein